MKILELINNKNEIYEDNIKKLQQLGKLKELLKSPEAEDNYKKMKFQQWQFIHIYASELSTFILSNITNIKDYDLSVFDLIPYIVWNKMTDKAKTVIFLLKEENNK